MANDKKPTNLMDISNTTFGMPPKTHVSDHVMRNSMPTATITPCEPEFSKGLSLFSLKPDKGWKEYLKLLWSVGFDIDESQKNIKVAYLADSFPTDTFNNEYGETFLDKFAQVASGGLGDLAQIAGWTNFSDMKSGINEVAKVLPSGGMITKAMDKVGNVTDETISKMNTSNQQMANSIINTMKSVATGGRVDFPQVWKNSSFTPSYSMTIRLYNPDPSSEKMTKKYIVGPIAALVSLGIPKVGDDSATYKWPLLCKVKCPGIFHLNSAYINSIAVIKGGDQQSIAYNQNLAMCDVRIDFGSLYNSVLAGGKSSQFGQNRPTLGTYLESIGGKKVEAGEGNRIVYEIHEGKQIKKRVRKKVNRQKVNGTAPVSTTGTNNKNKPVSEEQPDMNTESDPRAPETAQETATRLRAQMDTGF